jgi:uncharacterized membrane protein YhfC
MEHLTLPGAGWFTAAYVACAFALVYPLIAAFFWRQRMGTGWKYFGFGALIFGLFQLITRLPLIGVIGGALRPTLQSSATAQWLWITALALSAAVFEEVGRYVGYRWLMRNDDKTWAKAVMYGLGHGGIEAIVLVGLGSLLTLVSLQALATVNLATLPAATHTAIVKQYGPLATQSGWVPLLSLWERLWTLPVHAALSVVVLQVFRRGEIKWLWYAIGAHALFDGVTVWLIQLLGPGLGTTLLVEAFVALGGMVALYATWALRPAAEVAAPPSQVAPATRA